MTIIPKEQKWEKSAEFRAKKQTRSKSRLEWRVVEGASLAEGQHGMDMAGEGTVCDLVKYCMLNFIHSGWGTKSLKHLCYSYYKMFLLKTDTSNQLSFWLLLFSGNRKWTKKGPLRWGKGCEQDFLSFIISNLKSTVNVYGNVPGFICMTPFHFSQ